MILRKNIGDQGLRVIFEIYMVIMKMIVNLHMVLCMPIFDDGIVDKFEIAKLQAFVDGLDEEITMENSVKEMDLSEKV